MKYVKTLIVAGRNKVNSLFHTEAAKIMIAFL
jgi:hypothetical protein